MPENVEEIKNLNLFMRAIDKDLNLGVCVCVDKHFLV